MRDYCYALATDKKRGFAAALLKLILLVLSFVYVLIIALVKFCYQRGILRRGKLCCKVISVGNITLGGSGKTPFVKMLAKHITQEGNKVAILIRGYKRKIFNPAPLIPNPETMGDEGYLLSKELGIPVCVGSDRIKTGEEAMRKYHPDIVIMDDGFQHWRLFRNIDIVLINALNPFGNGRVIPAGILREPFSALRRADIFVLTKSDLGKNLEEIEGRLRKINPPALIAEAVHQPIALCDFNGKRLALSYIKDKEIGIFSAIGDPESFFKTVSILGAKIKQRFEFTDHFNFTQQDLGAMADTCKDSGMQLLVTTQKDAVKIASLSMDASIQILILEIELKIIKNRDEFYQRLSGL